MVPLTKKVLDYSEAALEHWRGKSLDASCRLLPS